MIRKCLRPECPFARFDRATHNAAHDWVRDQVRRNHTGSDASYVVFMKDRRDDESSDDK